MNIKITKFVIDDTEITEIIVIGIIVGFFLVLLIICCGYNFYRYKKAKKRYIEQNAALELKSSHLRIYSASQMRESGIKKQEVSQQTKDGNEQISPRSL